MICSDPTFLERFLDLIRARPGIRCRSSHDNAEVFAVVIARVIWLNPHGTWNAHPDITKVRVGARQTLRQHMVLVSETDPLTRRIPNMHVRPAAQSARRKRGRDVTCIQIYGRGSLIRAHDHSLPVKGAILPVRSGVLRPQDKSHLILM